MHTELVYIYIEVVTQKHIYIYIYIYKLKSVFVYIYIYTYFVERTKAWYIYIYIYITSAWHQHDYPMRSSTRSSCLAHACQYSVQWVMFCVRCLFVQWYLLRLCSGYVHARGFLGVGPVLSDWFISLGMCCRWVCSSALVQLMFCSQCGLVLFWMRSWE